MEGEERVSEILDVVNQRSDVITQLTAEPLYPRDIVDKGNISRSTVTRALSALEEADLVEKQNGKYVATRLGELAVQRFESYRTEIKTLLSTKPLVQAFPEADSPPIELVDGADIYLRSEHGAFRPPEIVEETLRKEKGDTIAYFPTVINPNLPRIWYHNAIDSGNDMAIVLDDETYDNLEDRYSNELATIANKPDSSMYVGDGPSFGLVCVETSDQYTVLIVIYSGGAIEGTIVTHSVELHLWVKELFDQIRADATCLDDELQTSVSDQREEPTRADGA